MKKVQREPEPIVFPRADPEELAKFDPNTKQCTMNCGPHRLDPRSAAERMFLCDDCVPVTPYVDEDKRDAERYRTLRSMHWNDSQFCVVMHPKKNVKIGVECPSMDRLDELVDATIKARKEKS